MKHNDKIPSAQFDHIADIIKERELKNIPTFYSISIEQFEKTTPVAEKEYGYDNFKQEILKYTSDYNLSSITVALYGGKSRNVRAFQTFKVVLTKQQTPTVVFSGIQEKQSPGFEQIDSSIPVSRYYDEKFEYQMRLMRTEMEKTNLLEKVSQLTERYEEKLKEKDAFHAEKNKHLEMEIENLKDEIREFEQEIAKNEKDKHNSFGNIALGSISARAIESFAKSNIGQGVLRGFLGKEGYETLQGHLSGIEHENNQAVPQETARIITQAETNPTDPKQIVLNYIQKVSQSFEDKHLRMVYDIMEVAERNVKDLEILWNVAMEVKKQRNKAPGTTTTAGTPEETGEESEEDNDENLNQIE